MEIKDHTPKNETFSSKLIIYRFRGNLNTMHAWGPLLFLGGEGGIWKIVRVAFTIHNKCRSYNPIKVYRSFFPCFLIHLVTRTRLFVSVRYSLHAYFAWIRCYTVIWSFISGVITWSWRTVIHGNIIKGGKNSTKIFYEVLCLKGPPVSPEIPSAPKCSSRHFILRMQMRMRMLWGIRFHPSHRLFSRLRNHSTVSLTIPLGN